MLADVKIQLRVPYCSLDTRQVHLDIYRRPIDFVEHSVKLKSVDMPPHIEVKMKSFHVFTLNMQISVYTIRNQITTLLKRKRRNLFSFLNKVNSVK
jgi:hypothetical protein